MNCNVHDKLHNDFVSVCSWTPNDKELLTCSDDETLKKISADFNTVELMQNIKDFGYVTDMAFAPTINEKKKSDVLAIAAADGSFRILSAASDRGAYSALRQEKHVDIGKE